MEYNEAIAIGKGRRELLQGRKTPSSEKIFEIFYSFQSKRLVLENG